MSDDRARRAAEHAAQERREGELVAVRAMELRERPIVGRFDVEHLRAVHAYLFQDLAHYGPGVVRDDSDGWSKTRALEGMPGTHEVHYAYQKIAVRISDVLEHFGGPAALQGLSLDDAADRLATLYGDLDHLHGFYEGNSRTLREFTRELALAAGLGLKWTHTNTGATERNELYIARDVAVLDRAFPGLTPERGMATDDRAEYEASLALPALRRRMGERSLQAIIRAGLTQGRTQQQASRDGDTAESYWSGVARRGQGADAGTHTAAPEQDATNRPTRAPRRR